MTASLFATFRSGFIALVASCLLVPPLLEAESEPADFQILVFSKTAGFRHSSIAEGIAAVKKLGQENRFLVEATEDSAEFNPDNLSRFQAVVFLNTTGTLFDEEQRAAFRNFIQSGGGFVGIHSASDTEYDWEWYGKLVGAYFRGHPPTQQAVVKVENRTHPSTRGLEARWTRTDEWYNFRTNPRSEVNVLLSLDTDSFTGSRMEDDHPIAWYHEYDGGRAFYTGGGHTKESFSEEKFVAHLLGAIQWASGQSEAVASD
jgi:type 1 glutamine amidotransferase